MSSPNTTGFNVHKSLCHLLAAFFGFLGVLDVVFYNLPLHPNSCPKAADDGANNDSQLLSAFWLTFSLHYALCSIWGLAAASTTPEDREKFWGSHDNEHTIPQTASEGTSAVTPESASENSLLSAPKVTDTRDPTGDIYPFAFLAIFFCTLINTYLSHASLSQDHVDQCFWNAFPSIWYRALLWPSHAFYYVFLIILVVVLTLALGVLVCQEAWKLIRACCLTQKAPPETKAQPDVFPSTV